MEPFSASDPVELSDIVMRPNTNFDVTADGQRFLVTVPAGSGDTGDTAPAGRDQSHPQLVRGVEAAGADGAVVPKVSGFP